jgi:hypothetical protein
LYRAAVAWQVSAVLYTALLSLYTQRLSTMSQRPRERLRRFLQVVLGDEQAVAPAMFQTVRLAVQSLQASATELAPDSAAAAMLRDANFVAAVAADEVEAFDELPLAVVQELRLAWDVPPAAGGDDLATQFLVDGFDAWLEVNPDVLQSCAVALGMPPQLQSAGAREAQPDMAAAVLGTVFPLAIVPPAPIPWLEPFLSRGVITVPLRTAACRNELDDDADDVDDDDDDDEDSKGATLRKATAPKATAATPRRRKSVSFEDSGTDAVKRGRAKSAAAPPTPPRPADDDSMPGATQQSGASATDAIDIDDGDVGTIEGKDLLVDCDSIDLERMMRDCPEKLPRYLVASHRRDIGLGVTTSELTRHYQMEELRRWAHAQALELGKTRSKLGVAELILVHLAREQTDDAPASPIE